MEVRTLQFLQYLRACGEEAWGTILFCFHWEILPALTLLDKSIKGSSRILWGNPLSSKITNQNYNFLLEVIFIGHGNPI